VPFLLRQRAGLVLAQRDHADGTIFGKHVRQGRSQALGRVCLHEALGAFDGIHVGYLAPIKQTDYQRILDWFPFVEAVACWLGRIVMNWREIVGWGLVALGNAAGVLAAAVKGGTFEALTAASAAFTGAAAMWGSTNKSKA
jgi:hypothetical protein